MIDFRKCADKRNIVVVHPGQDIAVTRYMDNSCPNESPSSNFLLVEIFDSDHITLSGELIDYIDNLVKDKEKSDEKCGKYRKLYFDLLSEIYRSEGRND